MRGSALFLAAFLWAPGASAAVVVKALEFDGSVYVAGAGTISTIRLGDPGSGSARAGLRPDSGLLISGPNGFEPATFFSDAVSGPDFGFGALSRPSSGSGVRFGFEAGDGSLILPSGYASDGPLRFSSVFGVASFASLGIEEGRYLYTLANGDFIRLDADRTPEVVIDVRETPSGVVFDGFGALATDAFGQPLPTQGLPAIFPANGGFSTAAGALVGFQDQVILSVPFGSGGFATPTSVTGDGLGIDGTEIVGVRRGLALDAGYRSGAPLSFSSFFAGRTFASLGVAPGVTLLGLADGQTIVIRAVVAPAPVPLPGALPLLAAALGLLALRRRV